MNPSWKKVTELKNCIWNSETSVKSQYLQTIQNRHFFMVCFNTIIYEPKLSQLKSYLLMKFLNCSLHTLRHSFCTFWSEFLFSLRNKQREATAITSPCDVLTSHNLTWRAKNWMQMEISRTNHYDCGSFSKQTNLNWIDEIRWKIYTFYKFLSNNTDICPENHLFMLNFIHTYQACYVSKTLYYFLILSVIFFA